MKAVIEIELDETWNTDENILTRDILEQAVNLSEGVRMKLIYINTQHGKDYDKIESLVCNYVGVDPDELKHKTRKREVVEARQLCHYIAKSKGLGSLSSIGFRFGRKDHATVLHSIRTVTNMLQTSRTFRNQYESFIKSFNDTKNDQTAKA